MTTRFDFSRSNDKMSDDDATAAQAAGSTKKNPPKTPTDNNNKSASPAQSPSSFHSSRDTMEEDNNKTPPPSDNDKAPSKTPSKDPPTREYLWAPARRTLDFIDYTDATGTKLYNKAIAPLGTELFDGTASKLRYFLDKIQERAFDYGWSRKDDGILYIFQPDMERKLYLLTEYGNIDMEAVIRMDHRYTDTPGIHAQHSVQLGKALLASLTSKFANRIKGECPWEHKTRPCGLILLKAIISDSNSDHRAEGHRIRESLGNLHHHIGQVNYNITKFNTDAQNWVTSLACLGQESTDLLTYLFKSYLKVPDSEFLEYIRTIKNKHEEDHRVDLTPRQLMAKAKNKYINLIQENRWCQSTDPTSTAMALQARLDGLQAKLDKRNKAKKKDDKKPQAAGNKKKAKSRAPQGRPNNLKEVRHHNGRAWYFCCAENGGKCPDKWRVHKPEECKGPDHFKKRKQNENQEANANQQKAARRMELNQAYAAETNTMSDIE